MKNIFVAVLLLSIFSACTKKDDASSGKAKFVINDIRSVDLTNNTSGSDEFAISVIGDPEPVSLSVEDLPSGLHCQFTPSSGTPPFNAKVRFWNDFTGVGGIQSLHITGRSESGTRNYLLMATYAPYRGWSFGDSIYHQNGVLRIPGSGVDYPQLKILGGNSGILSISFAQGSSLPIRSKTYKISNTLAGADEIRITLTDGPAIYQAVGGNATGTFVFDSLGHFVFKCSKVEMSNGVDKKILNCNIYE